MPRSVPRHAAVIHVVPRPRVRPGTVVLIVLAVIIGVMQLESHVLQPLLLGRAVALHPLAVVLAIGTGLYVWGIAGALLAVPLLAVLNAGIRSLNSPADALIRPEHVDTDESEDSAPADMPDSELE